MTTPAGGTGGYGSNLEKLQKEYVTLCYHIAESSWGRGQLAAMHERREWVGDEIRRLQQLAD